MLNAIKNKSGRMSLPVGRFRKSRNFKKAFFIIIKSTPHIVRQPEPPGIRFYGLHDMRS